MLLAIKMTESENFYVYVYSETCKYDRGRFELENQDICLEIYSEEKHY